MAKQLRASNIELADAVRSNASLEYRQRVPQASQAGMAAVADSIFEYWSRTNEFVDGLVNRIGTTVVRQQSWNNPLGVFKGKKIVFGDTVQETHINLLKSYSYTPEEDTGERELFGQTPPDVQSLYHSITRQERIPVTINYDILRRAFLEEGGLSEFINKTMATVQSSDEWLEFLQMVQLFKQYNDRQGYFYVNVPDPADVNNADKNAKALLREMRRWASELKFPSKLYNAAQRHVWAKPEDLVLFCTPQVKAVVDVDGLAAAFNREDANSSIPVIEIPEAYLDLGADVKAILTTRDFFVVHDTLVENTSLDNPVGLYKNYWLHHHEIISQSLFVPAIAFTTGNATPTGTVTVADPGSVAVARADGGVLTTEIKPGSEVEFVATVSSDDETPAVIPNESVVWKIVKNIPKSPTSPSTRISQEGVLHVSRTERSDTIYIQAFVTRDENVKSSVNGAGQRVTPAVPIFIQQSG